MDSLLKDLRYAVRSLLKHPSFTLLAVITLGLGIGANTAIFSVLYAVLLQPLPYGEAERIVRVEETEGRGGMGVSPPNFIDFQEQNHSFERMAAYSGGSLILTGNGEPARLESATVSRDLFSVLKANPLLGRSFNATDENENQGRAAILSYGLWQARFAADHAIVGRQITLDGKAYSIVGVMSRDFEFPIQTNRVELWTPLTFTEDLSNLRGAHYLDVVGRVKPGVNPSEANADLELIAGRIAQQFPKLVSGRTTVVPIKNDLVGDVRPYLLMLSVAVAFVLLIAAANVASLMLARAAERQKEVALRLALGASRLRVLRQLLAESLLLSVIGGVAGILLALLGT